jgi:hypothetical protein
LRNFSGYSVTSGVSLWTSGIQDKYKKTSWCSKKFPATDEPLNWAGGQPPAVDGCLTLTLSNSSANLSTFELSNCNVEHYFVCEVCLESEAYFRVMRHLKFLQKTVADSQADIMQEECQDLHDITSGTR